MQGVAMPKTYQEINEKISSGKAVVLTAEEIIDYVERKGVEQTAREVDVVTTATFGAMCSSGCFLNFGHSKPKMRMSETWIDDVSAYSGLAAVDCYLGATQLRYNDPANMNYPGDFSFGGAHVIEKLVAGQQCQLFALSYGTDDYPRREIRTYFTIDDLNQATMVNPRNCYQNYNVATNASDKTVYSYLGRLEPKMRNATYSSAGQLSPLLNDPFYRTIGIGTSVWLAGARGIVHAEGTQHSPDCLRTDDGVPREGSGTLALTADMKKMKPDFVRGVSLRGYGVSLALGIAIPIPILDEEILLRTTVRDSQIKAPIIDYSHDYPERTGNILGEVTYAELRTGKITVSGKNVRVSSLSSYAKARDAAEILRQEIADGTFLLGMPSSPLPADQVCRPLNIQEADK